MAGLFSIIRAMIALVMEAVRTSEMLVNLYQTTRRYKPADRHLPTHRHENLKSYTDITVKGFEFVVDL
jgi:hypothetical protein